MISVIISLYNKQDYILNTINSILDQTVKDFELIIINDGSTDNSVNIINDINDFRIKIFNKSNGGVSSARNDGINYSNGEYLFFLDGDDIILPNCLEVLIELTSNFPDAELYTANYEVIFQNHTKKICNGKLRGYIKNPLKSRWEKTISPRIGNFLIKKQALEYIGNFDTNISLYEDLDFNIRMLSKCNVAYSPEVVLQYIRSHSFLSHHKLSLNKEFCWHITLDNASYYKKLLLADNINRSIYNRLKIRDIKSAALLLKKHKKYLFFLFYAMFKIK